MPPNERKRNTEICRLFADGARKVDLAKQFGLSAARVAQILAVEERRAKRSAGEHPFDALSVRAANCLRAKGLNTTDEVRAFVAAGALPDLDGVGKLVEREIIAWLAK